MTSQAIANLINQNYPDTPDLDSAVRGHNYLVNTITEYFIISTYADGLRLIDAYPAHATIAAYRYTYHAEIVVTSPLAVIRDRVTRAGRADVFTRCVPAILAHAAGTLTPESYAEIAEDCAGC